MNKCKCGCGREVTKPNNKYILGHNTTCREVLPETRHKLSSKRLGKTYKEIYGEGRVEQIKKNLWKNREKKDPPCKGKTWDEYYGKEKADEMRNNIHIKNTNNVKLKDRIGSKNPNYKGAKDSLYDHWYPKFKLSLEKTRKNKEDKIEFRCKYCNKWFTPTPSQMDNRIGQLKKGNDGCHLYCSDDCKELCSDHYQVLWPKYFKPYENRNRNVEVSVEVRKMVFERDNWECQKCENLERLECHHIDPVSQIPMFANDIDSCITLCVNCHKEIHMNIEGCGYGELQSNKKICV